MHLYILTGLPKAISSPVRDEVDLKFKACNFISLPAPHTGDIYTENYIEQICKSIAEHIYSFKKDSCSKRPETISIVYHQCDTSTKLKESCFIFSRMLMCNFENRFDKENTARLIEQSVNASRDVPNYPDCFFLPANNFHLGTEILANHIYRDIFVSDVEHDCDQIFCKKKFNSSNCNFLYGKRKATCFVDERNLIFPKCKPGECHGHDATLVDQEYIAYISGHYRFGVLKGCTFHYDAQYANKTLGSTAFVCSSHGEITAKNATHANVYLNDFIRFG